MKIRYFSWLKNITNKDSEDIHNVEVVDIQTLQKYLCKKYPKMNDYIIKENIIRIAVNLEYTTYNKKLSIDDNIALFPPVSGG